MRVPRFTILQMLLAAALVGLVLGLATSAWRTSKIAQITHLEYSPSGKFLAAKFSGGTIQVWDVSGPRPKVTAKFAGRGFLNFDFGQVRFADDATLVDLQNNYANNAYSTMIRTMDLKTGRAKIGPPIPFMSFAPSFAAGGQIVALPNWTGGGVELYDVQTGKLRSAIKLPGNPWYLSMSDDERYLAATDQNGGLHLIDLTNGKILLTKPGATLLAAVDIKGDQLAAALWSAPVAATGVPNPQPGDIELVQLPATGPGRTLHTGLDYFTWLRLSDDGSRLAVADYSAFEYYDVASGKRLSRIVLQGDDLQSAISVFSDFGMLGQNLALAPDGKTLASFSGGQITLRDLPSGKVRQTITGGWRSPQIVIFTLGFAIWSAAWGIVARRERLRRGATEPAQVSPHQLPPSRPANAPPAPLGQLYRSMLWIGLVIVLAGGLLIFGESWSILEVVGLALLMVLGIGAAVFMLATGYYLLARFIMGPHYLTLVRLRQVAHDAGRLHTSGQLTAAFFGPSNIEPQHAQRASAVFQRAADLFGKPVGLSRQTLIACLDRQGDLDAYMLRHVPIAAVVPNVWSARLALVCEETALRKLVQPADAFASALALILTIQYKRGLLPGWVGMMLIYELARSERTPAGLRAAVRRQRVLAARRPGWDPRVVFTRTASERAALWLAGDEPEAAREVQAELDYLATLGEMLLGPEAPAERREKVLHWLRQLKPKDDPLASLERDAGLTLEQLLAERQAWLTAQSGLPYEPLPVEKAAAAGALHAPILWDRTLPAGERGRVARQLGASGYVAFVPLLLDELDDPKCDIRFDVIEALENLAGQALGDDPDAWQAWYDALPADARAWPEVSYVRASATAPLQAVVLDDQPVQPAAAPTLAPPVPGAGRPLSDSPPTELKLCWGLMFLGGCAALTIPIALMFLWGPLYFPTIYFALVVGVMAVAKGAARDTLGLKYVAKFQGACLVACDPINMLLGAMEFNLLDRPHVLEYLARANGGRL